MTVPRALYVLTLMIITAIAVVVIRGESAKTAGRIQKLHQQNVQLEQELWPREIELARMRGPEAIRQRAIDMGLEVVPPSAVQPVPRDAARTD